MIDGFAMQGMDNVLFKLENLQADALRSAARAGAEDGLSVICEEAKRLCPRDTGELQASIRVRMTASGGEVAATAPHAAAVELGTAHHPAQPFLYPAMRVKQREALSGVQNRIGRQLKGG